MKTFFLALFIGFCAMGADFLLEPSELLLPSGDQVSEHVLILRNNTTDTHVVRSIRSGCSCITVMNSSVEREFPSKGMLDIHIRVDAAKISEKDFAKALYVEMEGGRIANLLVRGRIPRNYVVNPANSAMLRNITDVTQWSRSFTLHRLSSVDTPERMPVTLEEVEGVVVEVEPAEAGDWLVKISPELPLPVGQFQRTIRLDCGGEIVALHVQANVVPQNFRLESSQVVLPEVGTKSVVRIFPEAQKRLRHQASVGEVDWEVVAKDLQIQVPESIQCKVVVQKECIALEFQSLKVVHETQSAKILCQGRLVGEIEILDK